MGCEKEENGWRILAVTRNADPVPKDACTARAKLHPRRRVIYVRYVGFQHVGVLGQWREGRVPFGRYCAGGAGARGGGRECAACQLVSETRNQEKSYAKLITPSPNRDDVAFSFRAN